MKIIPPFHSPFLQDPLIAWRVIDIDWCKQAIYDLHRSFTFACFNQPPPPRCKLRPLSKTSFFNKSWTGSQRPQNHVSIPLCNIERNCWRTLTHFRCYPRYTWRRMNYCQKLLSWMKMIYSRRRFFTATKHWMGYLIWENNKSRRICSVVYAAHICNVSREMVAIPILNMSIEEDIAKEGPS